MENRPYAAPVRVDFGIAGLPKDADGLYLGGLYALKAGTSSARYPLLTGALISAVQQGVPCTFVLRSNPEAFVARLEETGQLDVAALAADRRVHFLLMQGEFQKKAFRTGVPAMLEELIYHGVPQDSLLIFDSTDEMLAMHDHEAVNTQIDQIAEWCRVQRIACLSVFTYLSPSTEAAINGFMDSLTGIARLDAERGGLALNFEYWRTPEGALMARQYRLRVLAAGGYGATPWTEFDAGMLQQLLANSRTAPVGDIGASMQPVNEQLYSYDPTQASAAAPNGGPSGAYAAPGRRRMMPPEDYDSAAPSDGVQRAARPRAGWATGRDAPVRRRGVATRASRIEPQEDEPSEP